MEWQRIELATELAAQGPHSLFAGAPARRAWTESRPRRARILCGKRRGSGGAAEVPTQRRAWLSPISPTSADSASAMRVPRRGWLARVTAAPINISAEAALLSRRRCEQSTLLQRRSASYREWAARVAPHVGAPRVSCPGSGKLASACPRC
jgi:hypothetical protein